MLHPPPLLDRFRADDGLRTRAEARAEPWRRYSLDDLWSLIFGPRITRSWMVWSDGDCPACLRPVNMYAWEIDPFAEPWKLRCPHCGERFPKNDFAAFHESGLDEAGLFDPDRADRGLLFNTGHPDPGDPRRDFGVDDGGGVPGDGGRWRFVGTWLIYGQWKALIVDGVERLAAAYAATGDPGYARKAGVLLDRVADVYPAFDFGEQAVLYERKADRGYVSTWHDACEEVQRLVLAYDRVRPALLEDDELLAFVREKAGRWQVPSAKDSGAGICAHIESRILRDTLQNTPKIQSNFPTTDVANILIRTVLEGREGLAEVYGLLEEVIDKATRVDGMTGEKGLVGYSAISPCTLARCLSLFARADEDFLPRLLERLPSLGRHWRFHVDAWVGQRFYPNIGDSGAAGGSHPVYAGAHFDRGGGDPLAPSAFTFFHQLYEATGDAAFCQVLHQANGGTVEGLPHDPGHPDPAGFRRAVKQVLAGQGPRPAVGSFNRPHWGLAVLRSGDDRRAPTVWLDTDSGVPDSIYGAPNPSVRGRGAHGHADGLNLGLYYRGVDLMVDLGYPPVNYGGWDSPQAEWYRRTASHQHRQRRRPRPGDGGQRHPLVARRGGGPGDLRLLARHGRRRPLRAHPGPGEHRRRGRLPRGRAPGAGRPRPRPLPARHLREPDHRRPADPAGGGVRPRHPDAELPPRPGPVGGLDRRLEGRGRVRSGAPRVRSAPALHRCQPRPGGGHLRGFLPRGRLRRPKRALAPPPRAAAPRRRGAPDLGLRRRPRALRRRPGRARRGPPRRGQGRRRGRARGAGDRPRRRGGRPDRRRRRRRRAGPSEPSVSGAPGTAAREAAERLADGLYPHQVEGLAFLLGRRRSILADDMGLGKTRQSVLALVHAEPRGPWLVVCPASVKRNWEREIRLVLPDAETHVAGPAPVPDPGFGGWVIINYDILKRTFDDLLRHGWRGLVFDEAHYLKNHTSQRSKLSTRLVDRTAGDPMVHALTGTPLTNRPRDLFPLLQLVDHSLGRSFFGFAQRYCAAEKNDYGHWITSGASNVEELAVQLHGIMLRRNKDEVLDLPPKVRSWIDVDIPEKAREALDEAVRAFLGDGARRDTRGRRMGIGMLASARKHMAIAKSRHTLEYVQGAVDQGEKVLVFTGFTNPGRRFMRHFGDQAVAVTGKTPVSQRQEQIDRFQEDESVRVYVGQIHAGGTGVNLTAARQVVFNDLDWVPANHWQAEDRAHRIGQAGTVNVTYMVARGTIEEFVRTVLENKARIVDELVEGRSLGDLDADVMSELQRMLRRLDVSAESLRAGEHGREHMAQVLRDAGEEYIRDQGERLGAETKAALVPVSEGAIQALAAVLAGPRERVYRIASSRDPGLRYTVEVIGADVTCDCRGFHYRGACTHARVLKDHLVSGEPLPDAYERVGEPAGAGAP